MKTVFEVAAGNVILLCIGAAGLVSIGVVIAHQQITQWWIDREYKALLRMEQGQEED